MDVIVVEVTCTSLYVSSQDKIKTFVFLQLRNQIYVLNGLKGRKSSTLL